MWILFALLGALTAAIVVILSKAGLEKVDSSVGFAIQSVLILIVAWTTVFIQKNSHELKSINSKAWIFLAGAGILTAVSSLFTFRALKLGEAAMVSPLERVSLVFVVIFGAIFLKEKLTWQVIVGALLMAGGAVLIALSKKSS